MDYTSAFELAIDKEMIYEVGGHWDINAEGACDGTNRHACGYTNDQFDSGGVTKYGIAQNKNPNVNVEDLDWEGAKVVYYSDYWLAGSCDKLPGRVAALHFDGCINNGVSRAAKFLQKAVNVSPDGDIGQDTLDALAGFDDIDVCNKICDQREQFYRDIVLAKPTQSKYLRGWLRRISEMRDFTTDLGREF
jgi:lysozyme family protein